MDTHKISEGRQKWQLFTNTKAISPLAYCLLFTKTIISHHLSVKNATANGSKMRINDIQG